MLDKAICVCIYIFKDITMSMMRRNALCGYIEGHRDVPDKVLCVCVDIFKDIAMSLIRFDCHYYF